MKAGERVVLVSVDEGFGPLRQPIKLGDEGVVKHDSPPSHEVVWVLFDGQDAAMMMRKEEVWLL